MNVVDHSITADKKWQFIKTVMHTPASDLVARLPLRIVAIMRPGGEKSITVTRLLWEKRAFLPLQPKAGDA